MEKQLLLQQSILTKKLFTLEDTKELERFVGNNIFTEFIQNVIDEKVNFDAESIIYMMETNSQKRDIDDPTINTLEDVKENIRSKNMLTLIDSEQKLYVAGDIHADLISLKQILKKTGFYKNPYDVKILFLGDYVDRGKNRLTVINLLITLEFLIPNNILLLKGNHELYIKDQNGTIKSPMQNSENPSYFFTFLNMLANHPEYSKEFPKKIIQAYASYFDNLPIIALIKFDDIKVMATHGGLPRADLHIDNYYDKQSFNEYFQDDLKDSLGMSVRNHFLWSDPYDKAEAGFRNTSNTRFKFNKDQFISFCKLYDIDLFLRAHEAQNDGYKTYFNERLISVFSTGGKDIHENINENTHSKYQNVTPNILYFDKESRSIKSYEIFFDDSNLMCEKEISFEAIKEEKSHHEANYTEYIKPMFKNNPTRSTKLFEAQKLIISDLFNPYVKMIFDLENSENINFTLNTTTNKFYGLHKDVNFTIDIQGNSIINNSDIKIFIDRFIIGEDEALPFVEGDIKLESGAILSFTIVNGENS